MALRGSDTDIILISNVVNATYEPLPDPETSAFKNAKTVVVKVTHRCNLDCAYCYENIQAGPDMSLETFKQLAWKVISTSTENRILFLLHGGEPTLLDSRWYFEAVNYTKKEALANGKEVNFAMQTNAINISEDLVCAFRDLSIDISMSIDGPSSIEASMRGRADAALQTYQQLTARGISVGVLTTINQSNYNSFRKICGWLSEDLKLSHFKANVMAAVGRGFHLPDIQADMVLKAQTDILEHMIATKGEGLIEDNLAIELFRFFSSTEERAAMPKELCRSQSCGAGYTVIGVAPNGELLPCGRFEWDNHEYFIGNVNSSSDSGMKNVFSKRIEDFHSLYPENWLDCNECEARDICSFGCQAFTVRSKSKINIECIPTKLKYEYFNENSAVLRPVFEKIKSRGIFDNSVSAARGYSDYSDSYYSDYSDRR